MESDINEGTRYTAHYWIFVTFRIPVLMAQVLSKKMEDRTLFVITAHAR